MKEPRPRYPKTRTAQPLVNELLNGKTAGVIHRGGHTMIQQIGDLFFTPCDVICIPTSGQWNSKGKAIMDAGIALEAKVLWPGIETTLGTLLKDKGNHPHLLKTTFLPIQTDSVPGEVDTCCVDIRSFPIRDKSSDTPDIGLIEQSANTLLMYINWFESQRVLLPRVGCEEGGLKWKDVEPVLDSIFDDRFIIVTKDEEDL